MIVKLAHAKDILSRVQATWTPPEFMRIEPIDYAEKFVRITTEDDPPLVIPFRRNPVQQVYYGKKLSAPTPRATGKRIIVLKSRRMGITTIEQALSYARCRTQRGSECITVAQTKPETEKIFKMVKRMHDDDPNKAKLNTDRKDALSYKLLRSTFTLSSAASTAVARGSTLSKVHGSEVAFWETNDQDTRNLIVALGEAARKGEMVLESTANGVGGFFYDTWKEAEEGKGIWSPIFLGWYMDSRNSVVPRPGEREQIIETLTEEEIFLVERFNCDIGQLAWRREKSKGGEKAKKLFKQEYPATAEEAFISSGMSYFSIDTIETRMRQCKDPIRESEGMAVWKDPQPGCRYIVAADTSEGTNGSDPSPIVVLEWETGEQCLRLNWSVKPHVLGRKCVELAKLYNGAIIAIECNNTGHSALNTVLNQENYGNVYYHENDVRDESRMNTTPGWRTDGKTRPVLLGDLEDALEKNLFVFNDKLFLSQCRAFRDNGNGKAETGRGQGHHGDLVIAWGIAWQVRKTRAARSSLLFI